MFSIRKIQISRKGICSGRFPFTYRMSRQRSIHNCPLPRHVDHTAVCVTAGDERGNRWARSTRKRVRGQRWRSKDKGAGSTHVVRDILRRPMLRGDHQRRQIPSTLARPLPRRMQPRAPLMIPLRSWHRSSERARITRRRVEKPVRRRSD